MGPMGHRLHSSRASARTFVGSAAALAVACSLAGCSGSDKKIDAGAGATTTSVATSTPDASSTTTTAADASTTTTLSVSTSSTAAAGGTGATTTKAAGTSTTAPPAGSAQAKLQAAMLTQADLPGYTSKPAADDDDTTIETCMPGNEMAKSDVPGGVKSPTFQKGTEAQQLEVSSQGLTGSSVAVATDFVTRLGSQEFIDCLKRETSKEAQGATVTVEKATATGGDQATGIHVAVSAAGPGGTAKVEGYILFARKGATVVATDTSATGLNAAPPANPKSATQERLTKVVSRL